MTKRSHGCEVGRGFRLAINAYPLMEVAMVAGGMGVAMVAMAVACGEEERGVWESTMVMGKRIESLGGGSRGSRG